MPVFKKDHEELFAEWIVEYIYERPVIDNSPASIQFEKEKRLVGNASCNTYFGTYELIGSSLSLNAAGKTNKMCVVAAQMEQEARFLDALPNVASYEILGGILFLKDEDGETVFRAAQHS